ncbi:uncharacterized protein [Rutidosis leptorrhynchoides]|uniref:uncharacterized protein n=1 Tax=Rutidosis leptorrhynchoides TaxID=125765 RepID=UPI003A99A824
MALLKYGRQMVTGLSRSQQNLRFGRLLTTTSTHHSSSEFVNNYHDELKYGRRIIGLPLYEYPKAESAGGFFTKLFRKKDSTLAPAPPLPVPGSAADLLGKIMNLTETIKSSTEVNTDVSEISLLLKEMLGRATHETTVKLLYELARPAASPSSPPPVVIDSLVKFVDNLPTKIVPLFQDMTVDMLEERYLHLLDLDISCCSHPQTVIVTADVSPLRNQSIKVFIARDFVVVTGTDKQPDPSYDLTPSPKQLVTLPCFRYHHHKVTARIIRGKFRIVFPRLDDSMMVNIPRVFEVNVDYGAPFQTCYKDHLKDSILEWMDSVREGCEGEREGGVVSALVISLKSSLLISIFEVL